MEQEFRFADELGPEKIVHIHHPGAGLKAVVVVDNVAAGPSIGGSRMAPDVSTEECVRLARAMTFKNAAAGLPHGGGKSVIFADSKMPAPEKERLVRAFARAIRDLGDYIVGPDMGTDETCMAWIHDEIGRSVGLPREVGGIPLDEIGATGFGLNVATDVARRFCGLEIKGARVVVQGFGSVGKHAARCLVEQGAVLIAAADTGGTVFAPEGLDLQALIALKARGASVTEYDRGRKLAPDAVIDVECEIWIPAARPDVIDESNVARVKTKLMPQGANIPVTAGAERILHERGVLVIPDFIANAGGVICAAVEYAGGSEHAAMETIEEQIGRNTEEVLREAERQDIPPRQAAREMAEHRVRAAMSYRRWR
jgi:glutamate dehydrogenase (NAD(P)+)